MKKWLLPLLAAVLISTIAYAATDVDSVTAVSTSEQRTKLRASITGGPSTVNDVDLLASGLACSHPSGTRFSAEVQVATASTLKLYVTRTVASVTTSTTVLLNGGTALTAGAQTVVSWIGVPSETYNLRLGTTSAVNRLVIVESWGGSTISVSQARTAGGGGSGSVSWPLTAMGVLNMNGYDVTNVGDMTFDGSRTITATGANSSITATPSGSGSVIVNGTSVFNGFNASKLGTLTFGDPETARISVSGSTFTFDNNGVGNATIKSANISSTAGNPLVLSSDAGAAAAIILAATGGVDIDAQGTNKSITLTPSGTGAINLNGGIVTPGGAPGPSGWALRFTQNSVPDVISSFYGQIDFEADIGIPNGHLFMAQSKKLNWGSSGINAPDLALRRSAVKTLTLDDNAAGVATLDVLGTITARDGGGATGTLTANALTGSGALTVTATGATLGLAATGANAITASTNSTQRVHVGGTGLVGIGDAVTASGTRVQITEAAAGTQDALTVTRNTGTGGYGVKINMGSTVNSPAFAVIHANTAGTSAMGFQINSYPITIYGGRVQGEYADSNAVAQGVGGGFMLSGNYSGGGYGMVVLNAAKTSATSTNTGADFVIGTATHPATSTSEKWRIKDTGTLRTSAGLGAINQIEGPTDQPLTIATQSTQNLVLAPNSTADVVVSTDQFRAATNGATDLGTSSIGFKQLFLDKTINVTAGDSATIDKSAGRFRKDTSGTTFTLTNNLITANSVILLTPANAAVDATALYWTVSAGAGTATITFVAAPTADFDMNFVVVN